MSMQDAGSIAQFAAADGGAACMITSMLDCLHCDDPAAYPLTAAKLEELIQQQIAAGLYSRQSGETLSAVDHQLQALGIAGRPGYAVYPYAEPWPHDWQAMLTTIQGHAPILLQLANGSAFGYSPGLRYHGVACLQAFGAQPYFGFADPANPASATGQLVRYTDAQIAAAQPCGMIVFPIPQAPAPAPAPDDDSALAARVAALEAAVSALKSATHAAGTALAS